jgi:hypothetical protein
MDNQATIFKRNLPRDVFLHLFAIVALYWLAVSFITICWQYVNYFFPDIETIRYGYQSYVWPIRFSVSSLIIIFPLFILASWYLNKIYQKEIAVRESKIRKWLIYLTLFVASLIIIGDLVTVIYNFLGGDVTTKFTLKALSVLVVAASIFGYYLDDVRRTEPSKSAKYYAWVTGIVILVLVVGAFFIVGSPKKARLFQLDQQRIGDLQNIQGQIVNYWQRKGRLPENLSDLDDSISGYFVPNDPETGSPYEYAVKDSNKIIFELCAILELDSMVGSGSKIMSIYSSYDSGYSQNWEHKKGRNCFERQIDKQLYPPFDKGSVKTF